MGGPAGAMHAPGNLRPDRPVPADRAEIRAIDRRDGQGLGIGGELRWSASWAEAEVAVAPFIYRQ